MIRWRLDTETATQIKPAPGKSIADDSADIVLSGPGHVVGAVCDGVTGSEGGGGGAADIALGALSNLVWPTVVSQAAIERWLLDGVRQAHAAVRGRQQVRNSKTLKSGTTTCTLGAVYGVDGKSYASVAWVGDSPAEIIGSYGARPITPLDPDSSAIAPPALGARESVSPSVKTLEIRSGEALLLHSDGFCLDGPECQRIYRNSIEGGHGWQKFLEQAMGASRLSDDDKSAVLIGIMTEPRQESMPPRKPIDTRTDMDTPVRPPARVQPARSHLSTSALVLILALAVLAAGAVGLLVGRQKVESDTLRSLRASFDNRGVTGAGEHFVISKDGTVLPVSSLTATAGPKSLTVYKLIRDNGGQLSVKPVSKLTVSHGMTGAVETLVFRSPTKGARAYLDGARVDESPTIRTSDAQEHSVAFYVDGHQSAGYRVVPKTGGQVVIVPITPGAEPVQ